jgi:hypothetical protein
MRGAKKGEGGKSERCGVRDREEGACSRFLSFFCNHQTTSRLQALILRRLDHSTLHYIGEAEKHVDNETFNLQVEGEIQRRLKFGLWGNVVKDPRWVE